MRKHPSTRTSTGRGKLVVRWASLWNAMQAAGLDDASLASKIGVPSGTVRDWRTGARTPTLATLEKIAAALGVSTSDILPAKSAKNFSVVSNNLRNNPQIAV